jgi:cytochrome P450
LSDLYDPFLAKDDDPFTHISRARQRCPIQHSADTGWWVNLGYREAEEIMRNPTVFSSRQLTNQRWDRDVLPFTDPPRHTRHRRLVFKAFTPARVEAMRPHMEEVTNEIIDGLPSGGGEFDLIPELANPLPMRIICEMLGIPHRDRKRFREWSEAVESAGSKLQATPEEDAAHDALNEYVANEVARRRAATDPPDDLITAVVFAEIDGERLTDIEARDIITVLLSAGNATTTNFIANLFWLLQQHPAEKQKLLQDIDGIMPSALEEGLRFDGPIHGFFRLVTEDTAVGNTSLAKGERIFNCYGAANRDPQYFPDPDQFCVDRDWETLPSHLSFGLGAHYCIGANLARMEAAVALKTVFTRLDRPRVPRGFVPHQKPGGLWRHWNRMPVIYDARH